MNILAEFSIFPMDKGESVSRYVSRAISIIEKRNVKYQLGPMGTCIEGELNEVMDLLKECMLDMKEDCNRIYLNLKMDYRKDRINGIKGKINSIKKHLVKNT